MSPARFGFNDNAERINSRACMVRVLYAVGTPCNSTKFITLTMLFGQQCDYCGSGLPQWLRACMQIGFFALIFVEAITGKGFLQLLGITVGRGIGFEI